MYLLNGKTLKNTDLWKMILRMKTFFLTWLLSFFLYIFFSFFTTFFLSLQLSFFLYNFLFSFFTTFFLSLQLSSFLYNFLSFFATFFLAYNFLSFFATFFLSVQLLYFFTAFYFFTTFFLSLKLSFFLYNLLSFFLHNFLLQLQCGLPLCALKITRAVERILVIFHSNFRWNQVKTRGYIVIIFLSIHIFKIRLINTCRKLRSTVITRKLWNRKTTFKLKLGLKLVQWTLDIVIVQSK